MSPTRTSRRITCQTAALLILLTAVANHAFAGVGIWTSTDFVHWTERSRTAVVTPYQTWEGMASQRYLFANAGIYADPGSDRLWVFYTGAPGAWGDTALGMASASKSALGTDGLVDLPWNNAPSNPILVGGAGWDQYIRQHNVCLKDGSEYKLYYTGMTPNPYEVGLATSNDGVTWTKSLSNPVLKRSWQSWSSMRITLGSVLKVGATYYAFYEGDNQNLNAKGSVGMATSPDGVNWTPYSGNPVINYSDVDPASAIGIYAPGVAYRNNAFHMINETYDGSTAHYFSATSPDGIHWSIDTNPGINLGSQGRTETHVSWDGEQYYSAVYVAVSVLPEVQQLPTEAGTANFTVTNMGPRSVTWQASVTAGSDWLSISSGSSGSNDGTIVAAYGPNNSLIPRSATIHVSHAPAIDQPTDIIITQDGPRVIYVDKDNISGPHTGTSWATAFADIQSAVDAAFNASGGEVWVAEGTYDEPRTSPMHSPLVDTGSIVMKDGVSLYGGFIGIGTGGYETARDQRNWKTHPTILDGSTARNGEPAYHVISGADNTALDGFSITGGSATGGDSDPDLRANRGGGLYTESGSLEVANCRFYGNSARDSGAAAFSSSTTNFVNCDFFDNSSQYAGGALMVGVPASITLDRCTFRGNVIPSRNASLTDSGGSAIYSYGALLTVTNCVFNSNLGSGSAVIHAVGGGTTTLSSSTFAANQGAGVRLYIAPQVDVTNCIFWDNAEGFVTYDPRGSTPPSASYSDIQGGYAGTGNINANPRFLDSAHGNYRLSPGTFCLPKSPCIDTGTGTGAPSIDIRDIFRPQGLGVDMGAYETIQSVRGDINGDGVVTATDLQLAINAALGLSIGELDADVNSDCETDAVDVQLVIIALLGL